MDILKAFRDFDPNKSAHPGPHCPIRDRWELGKLIHERLESAKYGARAIDALAVQFGMSPADAYAHRDLFLRFNEKGVEWLCTHGFGWRAVRTVMPLNDRKLRRKLLSSKRTYLEADWTRLVRTFVKMQRNAALAAFRLGRGPRPENRGVDSIGKGRGAGQPTRVKAIAYAEIVRELAEIFKHADDIGVENTADARRMVVRVGELVAGAHKSKLINDEVLKSLQREAAYVVRRLSADGEDTGGIVREYIAAVKSPLAKKQGTAYITF